MNSGSGGGGAGGRGSGPALSDAQASRVPALPLSIALHASVAGAILLAMALESRLGPKVEKIPIEVFEQPKPAPPNLNLAEPVKPIEPKQKPPEEPARKVFGVSRKALTADDAASAGASVKQGNTVATAPDNEKLKDSDADSLPIPTDEYLVSAMPRLQSEVRIPYPPEAKANGVEGPVVMEILIDAEGRVRETTLVSGPGHGLNEAALSAIKQFKFSPAQANGKSVAVRIRYTYRFVLER